MISLIQAKQYLGLSDKAVSIVGNGTTAIATSEDSSLKTGNLVQIAGTTNFNGIYSIVRLNATQFSFAHAHVGTEQGLIAPHDSVVNAVLAGTINFVNKYTGCSWSESQTGITKVLDCPSDGVLHLPLMPSVSVQSVQISRDRNFSDSTKYTALVENESFLFYDDVGRLELIGIGQSVLDVRKSVKVVYSTGTLPEGIKAATYALLRFYYQMENDKAHNLTSRTNAQDSVYFEKQVPEFILEMLNPYVRVGLGDFSRTANPIII